MKQKILLFSLLAWISWSAILFANDLTVRSNIDSGTYNFALEVYLLSNDKNAKIFYYTDGIGRFDTLKEFLPNDPLLIKKDTTLNFYAMNDMNNSTKIGETQYHFTYPENFSLSFLNGKIILTNTTNTTVNIGYFKIESDFLNYEIYKNTFLNPGENFTLKYTPKTTDTIKLITPNGKQVASFDINPLGEEKNPPLPVLSETKEISPEITDTSPVEKMENIPEKREIQEEVKNQKDTFGSENIKASVSETKNQSKDIYIILYGFVAFLFIMICYNVFTIIQGYKSTKKQKQKIIKK